MPRKPHAPRNHDLVRGVSRYSRSAMFRRSGKAAVKKSGHQWKDVAAVKKAPKSVEKTFNKTEKRTVVTKASRFYPAENIPRPIPSRKSHHKPAHLRSSITPGTVLIVLSGRFRGKRVIFLKQLQPSGLLLVTGPFKVNGVPVRRINQAYTIATSTKVDISGLEVPAKFDDAYFKKGKAPKKEKSEEEFFAAGSQQKKTIDAHRIADQKAFDAKVLEVVSKVPNLAAYLNAKFSLTKGQFPHLIKF
jgi:large subunit ribosomal protein L6e